MSQSLFGSQEMLNQGGPKNDPMSKSMNENLLLTNVETGKRLDFSYCAPKRQGFDMNKEISDLLQTKGDKLREADSPKLMMFQRSTENVSDPLLKLKYQLPETLPRNPEKKKLLSQIKQQDLNLSLEEDNFTVDPGTIPKRVASQDDIDRISKITNNSPLVSSQGASDKVKESIKEIEKNRQLLLAQQGSHLIEFEKRKVEELKKRSQDEARAKYLEQQQSWTSSLPRHVDITRSPKLLPKDNNVPYLQYQQQLSGGSGSGNDRPLSELSECSFEGNFLASSQNQSTPNRKEIPESTGSPSLKSENRNSIQSENSSEGAVVRRNIARHQRPLTRYLPIFSELNLREHIESAGHQIALCPHVFVDQTTCKG